MLVAAEGAGCGAKPSQMSTRSLQLQTIFYWSWQQAPFQLTTGSEADILRLLSFVFFYLFRATAFVVVRSCENLGTSDASSNMSGCNSMGSESTESANKAVDSCPCVPQALADVELLEDPAGHRSRHGCLGQSWCCPCRGHSGRAVVTWLHMMLVRGNRKLLKWSGRNALLAAVSSAGGGFETCAGNHHPFSRRGSTSCRSGDGALSLKFNAIICLHEYVDMCVCVCVCAYCICTCVCR